MAIAAVVVMVAAAAIGLGYAFQATYTDQISGSGSTTGQFLTVTDATYTGANAIKIEDTTASVLYLDCGTAVTKTASETSRGWDVTGAILSAASIGKTAITQKYSITKDTTTGSVTVKALYCLGAYKVTAPVAETKVTVAASQTSGTATQTASGYSAGTNTVCYILSADAAYASLDATVSSTTLTDQIIGTSGSTFYLYALASWTLGVPTADAPAATLSLSASTPVLTATADSYGTTTS